MNSVKTKKIAMLGTGYFLKIAKKKKKIKQSVLIAKNSLRKTRKMDNRQKLTPAKVSCTM